MKTGYLKSEAPWQQQGFLLLGAGGVGATADQGSWVWGSDDLTPGSGVTLGLRHLF